MLHNVVFNELHEQEWHALSEYSSRTLPMETNDVSSLGCDQGKVGGLGRMAY